MAGGGHFGHDGKLYRTLTARNQADKVFDQTNAGRRGKGNSHTGRGAATTAPWHSDKDKDKYTEAEWEEWQAQWPKPAAATPDKEDPAKIAEKIAGMGITTRHPCGRFSCKKDSEGFYSGVTCKGCLQDWVYPDMHGRLCNL